MKLSEYASVGIKAGISLFCYPHSCHAEKNRACPYADKIERNSFLDIAADAAITRPVDPGKRGVLYMNRIAPSGSQLWIASADGGNATRLMGDQSAPFDYHPSWSPDSEWIVFTSERRADGQSDLYRVKTDGTQLEDLVSTDSFEDIGSLSPDGHKLVYLSTAINYTTNVFVKDLRTGVAMNITGSDETVGSFSSPHSFYRPAWSPDGEWVAFSSDINTDWTGHSGGTGWEHTQTLSLYVIRPNGTDFRKVLGKNGFCLGSPKWSPDGSRLVYYNMTTEGTYGAHGVSQQQSAITSQIFSVDLATGTDIRQLTFSESLKVSGAYLGNSTNVSYLTKAGASPGINYTTQDASHSYVNRTLRNPSFSPDGTRVVYEVYDWAQRPAGKNLFTWDTDWEYRFMDVFPQFNNASRRLASTEKQLGNVSSSVVITSADYDDLVTAFNVYDIDNSSSEKTLYASGLAGAFQPTFNPDGSLLAVGLGSWFTKRVEASGMIYLFSSNGSHERNLTDGTLNAGFPSFSPDGKRLVYRLWDQVAGPMGLHVMDVESGATTQITRGWDNTPGWSPDGRSIVFTRQTNWTAEYGTRWYADRFDICTVNPDGTNLAILTDSDANDAHAVWSYDGRIMYNSGMYGFRDESALYDETFQPYGQIVIMNADGSDKMMLTDSMWEDSMPLQVPREFF